MTQDAEMTALFASLYRATSRQSLFDIEAVLAQLEALPRTRSQGKRLAREQLRCFIGEALDKMEMHLSALRTRYAALPELEPKLVITDEAHQFKDKSL